MVPSNRLAFRAYRSACSGSQYCAAKANTASSNSFDIFCIRSGCTVSAVGLRTVCELVLDVG